MDTIYLDRYMKERDKNKILKNENHVKIKKK